MIQKFSKRVKNPQEIAKYFNFFAKSGHTGAQQVVDRPGEDVGVVSPRERFLQFLQLERRERRSVASLLTSRLKLFQLALGQLSTAGNRGSVVGKKTGGFTTSLLVEIVNVDLFFIVDVVVVVKTISSIGLARVFASRVWMAALRSVLVLEVQQL